MTYHNILSNPTLQTVRDDLHVEKIHVLDFPPQEIWHPIQWRTTVVPTVRGKYQKRADDHHIIPTVWPQTVNGKSVLTIEANTKHFTVSLQQQKIPLKAHQRYLVKVLFNPAVEPLGDAEPSDLTWRIRVDKRSTEFTDGFQSVSSTSEWGNVRSALLVVHSYEAQVVDLWAEFWSKWGNLDKQIFIHSIEILEVEADYGDDGKVHKIGTPTTQPPGPSPVPDPDPPPLPDPTLPTLPAWGVLVFGIVGAIIAGVVIYSLFQGQAQAPQLTGAIAEESNLMEELLNNLFAIPVFATVLYTSGLVYFLVELWKRAKARWLPAYLNWATPEFVAIGLVVVFLGAHGVAVEYVYDDVLKDFAKFLTDLVGVMGPYILGMIGTNAVVSYGYDKLRNADVPGFTFGK